MYDNKKQGFRYDNDCLESNPFSSENDAQIFKLEVGESFPSEKEFTELHNKFASNNYFRTSIELSRNFKPHEVSQHNVDLTKFPRKELEIICVHYGTPKNNKNNKNIRTNVSSIKVNCTYKIRLAYKWKLKKLVITSYNDKHCNHVLTKEAFQMLSKSRQLNEEELKLYFDDYYENLKVPLPLLKNRIYEDIDKVVTTKDILNIKMKRRTGKSDLQLAMDELKKAKDNDPGCSLIYGKLENNPGDDDTTKLGYWYFQSSQMKIAFEKFSDVLLVDGTYKLDCYDYVLYPFNVITSHGKTITIAFIMVSDSTLFTIQNAFEVFYKENMEHAGKVQFVMTDKCRHEIKCLQNYFKNAHFLLCQWHAKNSLIDHIKNIKLDTKEQAYKQVLIDSTLKLLYTKSEKIYNKTWESIQGICKLSTNLNSFLSYFEENWHNLRNMWASHIISQFDSLDTITNNRSESTNNIIKKYIKKHSSLYNCVKGLILFSKNQFEDHRQREIIASMKVYNPSDISSSLEKDFVRSVDKIVNKEIAIKVKSEFKEALELLNLKKIENIDLNSNQTHCTLQQGICLAASYKIPCRHLFLTKMYNNEPLVEKEFFHPRWEKGQDLSQQLNTPQTNNCNNDIDSIVPMIKTDSDKSRFNTASNILKPLNQTLSRCTDKERMRYEVLVDDLNKKIISDSPQIKKDDFEFSLVNSKKRHHLLKDKKKPLKKRKITDFYVQDCGDNLKSIKEKAKLNDTDDWQDDLNNFFTSHNCINWLKEDFNAVLSKTEWLNDSHFEWVNALIKLQCPEIKGLQNVLSHLCSGFKINNPPETFIQFVNNGESHWILVSNKFIEIEKRENEVSIYNSLLNGEPNDVVKKQISQILKNDPQSYKNNQITIRLESCPQQKDSYNCGLFAIANAVSLMHNINPNFIKYTGDLRQEFIEMLKEKKLIPFKHKKVKTQKFTSF